MANRHATGIPAVLLAALSALPLFAQTLPGTIVNSWVGNDGGTPQTHIPHSVNSMYVRSDGTAYAITQWDEGGHNVCAFKDGRLVAVPRESGTGSFGRNSGQAVVADSAYIYQLMSQHGCDGGNASNNQNGLAQYPPCVGGVGPTWHCVHRYLQNGQSAPFALGYGFDGAMLLVNTGGEDLAGIAIIGNELFVADLTGDDTIKVYSLATMSSTPLRRFHVDRAGFLAGDRQGFLWMLQRADSLSDARLVRLSALDGAAQAQSIAFPAGVTPWAFCVDNVNDRVLVTDIGVAQNVRIYTNAFSSPVLSLAMGTAAGIYSGIPGEIAPLKFNNPKGVGIDSSGNIYVASNGQTGQGGTSFESYTPAGAQRWELRGLVFTASADIDRANWKDVYTFDKHLTVDLSRSTPGSEWSYRGYTIDRFRYPQDARLTETFFTSVLVRRFGGRKFLFASDMYGSTLAVYRFNTGADSIIAIPAAFLLAGSMSTPCVQGTGCWPVGVPTGQEWIWRDLNGDGAFSSDEYDSRAPDNIYSMAWWVDSTGGIWKGVREQGLRYFPCEGIDAHGVPQYSYAASTRWQLPEGTNGVKRIWYDVETDELWLAGFSSARPDTGDSWWCMGSVLYQYRGWLRSGQRTPTLTISVPFSRRYAAELYDAKSFCVEGDYVFVSMSRDGRIIVYNRTTGAKAGEIMPGTVTGERSGWSDINIAITAHKRPGGEYLVYNEENGYGKVMMYRWCPNGSCAQSAVTRGAPLPAGLSSARRQNTVRWFAIDGTELTTAERASGVAVSAKGLRVGIGRRHAAARTY